MPLKQATKRIIISSEEVNSHGFWTKTDGIDLSLYNQNPIMLWQHNRPKKEATVSDVLPIGIIQDIKLENNLLTGLPAFDDTDEFAMRIYNKYEAGIINMASAGLEPRKLLTDSAHMKNGAPCLVECLLKEVSLTDIGSNKGALKLFNSGKEIQLNSPEDIIVLFQKENNTDMLKQKELIGLLQLSDDSNEDNIINAVKNLQTEHLALTNKNKLLADQLADLQKKSDAEKIATLVDGAVAAKKITPAQKEQYVKLAEKDFEGVRAIIDTMPAHTSVETALGDKNDAQKDIELTELTKQSGDELFRSGKLQRLKELSMPHFKVKYKEFTGKDYAE